MILFCLLLIPLAAGPVAWILARRSAIVSRLVALAALLADFGLALALWVRHSGAVGVSYGRWLEELDLPWIPAFGIHFHLALDGLSLPLLLLTFFLGAIAVLASWREIDFAIGFLHLNLLWLIAGVVGVFLAVDLFCFYFAWELMLVPMALLIAIWGHERRVPAAIQFFLFTQLSSLLMLIAILALYFVHHDRTGVFTFEYRQLLHTPLSPHIALLLMLGFFSAFAVKLPMIPLHSWLPSAYTEAPTAGSILVAGVLSPTAGYGLLRFVVPLFPEAARELAPYAMALGAAGIIYGALVAFGQTDFKRLIAFASLSHVGFVLIGVFAWQPIALQGALTAMLAHGLSTGALFLTAGILEDRVHTRQIRRLGGLWSIMPRLAGTALFFALASLGLPGLGDFIGEFLVLQGAWSAHKITSIFAAIGALATTLYALRFIQRVFHGENVHFWRLPDLSRREVLAFAPMVALLLWLGLYPQPVFNLFQPAMTYLQQTASIVGEVVRR